MTSRGSVRVRDAVVLAAGNGDRFQNGSRQSKVLHPVLGRPLILRTLKTAADAGISTFHVVVGYQADSVQQIVTRFAPPRTVVRVIHNPEWHLENGVSVLAVREWLDDRRFALLMGDHLFESSTLARLLRTRVYGDETILATDARPVPDDVAAEATKVRLCGDRITAIGKDLPKYDAVDTGVFVCAPSLFTALYVARAGGDTTLSGGIRELARRRLMRAVDIGGSTWCDIDTVDDLKAAENLLVSESESEVA